METLLLQEGTDTVNLLAKATVQGPPPPTGRGRALDVCRPQGVYDGGLPAWLNRKPDPIDFVGPTAHFLPPGTKGILIIPLITELGICWALPTVLKDFCVWSRVGARVSTSASSIHVVEGKALGGISEEAGLVLGRFIVPFNNTVQGLESWLSG